MLEINNNFLRIVSLLCALFFTASSHAVEMRDIEFNSGADSSLNIKITFDGTPPTPGSYSISDPARIAIDLPGVKNALPQRKYKLDFDNAQSLVAVEANDRSRLVINLLSLVDYEMYVKGKELFIDVAGNSSANAIVGVDEAVVRSSNAASDLSKSAVTELNFQRGEQGEGRLLIELTDPTVDVNVQKRGEYIIVKLMDTFLSDDQRHVYDVLDFATSVKEFSADQVGRDVQIKLLPLDNTDYLAYQTDDLFIVSVAPAEAAVAGASRDSDRAQEYGGERLSLNFQDIEVRGVLQLIADFTGLNLVASDTVSGNITMRLDNVPWDQALDIVLKTKGLAKRINGNVMLVGNAEEIAEQERIELEANKQIVELLPLQTEHIKILYAKANTLSQMLSTNKNGVLSDRGSVLVDERTNSMIVTDTAKNLTEVRGLIELLDVPVKQIMIEARIVSANDDFSRELGIRWGGASVSDTAVLSGDLDTALDISSQIQNRAADFNSAVAGGTNPAQAAADLDPLAVNFPGAALVDLGVGGAPSSIALSYLGSSFNVAAELSALESNGQGEVVSQPKVITGDKQQASIKAGQEVGFQQATASGATSVAFKEAVLQLDVVPSITPDNRIIMDLTITQDTISGFVSGENNSQIPVIDTTELQTQVLISNGETIVLGGVFEQTDLNNVVKTPVLGDVPVVGRLFRRTVKSQIKRETLIFITPRIISESLAN